MGVRLTETEDMALSAFDDKSKQPQAGDLKKTLGRASAHWDNLIAHIAAEYALWKRCGSTLAGIGGGRSD